jgi:hypothetical protein
MEGGPGILRTTGRERDVFHICLQALFIGKAGQELFSLPDQLSWGNPTVETAFLQKKRPA